MRISVWGINYAPENVGIGRYTSEMCEYLAQSGFDVTVTTGFPYYPQWFLQESHIPLYRTERINNVEIQRCWLYVPKQPTVSKRIIHELSFGITSFIRLLFSKKADIYFVISPPLVVAMLSTFLKVIKPGCYFVHMQDTQPEAAVALGMLKPGLLLTFLRWAEKTIYSSSTVVSGISTDMCDYFEGKGISKDKIYCLPNWVETMDTNNVADWATKGSIERRPYLVTYAGNMGAKQGLQIVIESARILKDRKDILFVIAGNGSIKEELIEKAAAWGLSNVAFLNVLPDAEHTQLLMDSTVFLIPQMPGVGSVFFPSKLLKAIALGCPILSNASSESSLYKAIKSGGYGLIAPTEPNAFAAAITNLIDQPELRQQLSEAGKSCSEKLNKNIILNDLCNKLRTVGKQN